jgi:hypothetical protein
VSTHSSGRATSADCSLRSAASSGRAAELEIRSVGGCGELMITWEVARPFFEFDGALRDLYAFDVRLAHWQRFLDWLRSARIPYSYIVDHDPAELPTDVVVAFDSAAKQPTLLSLLPSFGAVNCHFFSLSQLELDLWPTDIQSEHDFQELLQVVEELALAIGAPLSLTMENVPKVKLFTYDPATDSYQTFHDGPVWAFPRNVRDLLAN